MSDDAERHEYEAVVTLAFETTEQDIGPCLVRSGLAIGVLLGETLITDIELRGPGLEE